MKAKDLMIGDWVENPLGYKAQVNNIRWIPKDKCDDFGGYYLIDIIRGEGYKATLSEDEVKPVKLTDEILTANDFYFERNVGYLYEDGEYEVIISLWSNYYRILYNHDVVIDIHCFWDIPVHELQHAMRLAGLDKEFKLEG